MTRSTRFAPVRHLPHAMTVLALAVVLTLTVRTAAAQMCVGDCNMSDDVTINELVVLVNIVLGSAQPSACANGIPSGSAVTVPLLVKAVNNLLNGCHPAPTPTPGGIEHLCGNGTVDSGEDCDNGGTCIGGTNAGTACTSEGQ